MQRSRCVATVLLTVFAFFSSASQADSQACDSSCSDGTCVFDGLVNVPIGAATLSVNEGCQLVIDGIGSGGGDGVEQVGLESIFMATELLTPNFSLSIVGTSAVIRQVGIAGGKTQQELMLTRVINYNDTNVRLSISCAEVLVQEYVLQIYDGETLVSSQSLGASTPLIIYPKADMARMACAILPNSDLTAEIEMGASCPFSVLSPGADPGPFEGDRIFVYGLTPLVQPELQTAIENRFAATGGPVVITHMEVEPAPSSGVPLASPRLGVTAFPNPFRLETNIAWRLDPGSEIVSLAEVMDVTGRVVRRGLTMLQDGDHAFVRWDGKGAMGLPVNAGVYFIRIPGDHRLPPAKVQLVR